MSAVRSAVRTISHQMLRQKSFSLVSKNVEEMGLTRSMKMWSLIGLGVGNVVGAGIFVLTGQAAARYAGPSLAISFVVASAGCFFAGLCYAELAAAIPITGSSYSFTYVACGEALAWFVGMCLMFENLVGSAAVAEAWSAALKMILLEMGITWPTAIGTAPLKVLEDNSIESSGGIFNLPAVLVIVIISGLLSMGLKTSMRFNNIAVIVKLCVLLVFVAFGIYYAIAHWDYVKGNLTPFVPPNEGGYGKFGASGIFRGAGAIFFAYVGFDNVCTVAQECENPGRDLPRGIFGTLSIATVLYVLVTVTLTGLMHYTMLDVPAPVITAFNHVQAHWTFRIVVELGMLAGVTSVCLAGLLGISRLILMLANDGLLPKKLSLVSEKYRTPLWATMLSGVLAASMAAVFPLDLLGEMVSFGTLVAMIMVCVSALRMRWQYPDQERPFRAPALPIVGGLGILICFVQLFSLPMTTWRNCSIIFGVGMIYYMLLGRKTSNLESLEVPLTEAGDHDDYVGMIEIKGPSAGFLVQRETTSVGDTDARRAKSPLRSSDARRTKSPLRSEDNVNSSSGNNDLFSDASSPSNSFPTYEEAK